MLVESKKRGHRSRELKFVLLGLWAAAQRRAHIPRPVHGWLGSSPILFRARLETGSPAWKLEKWNKTVKFYFFNYINELNNTILFWKMIKITYVNQKTNFQAGLGSTLHVPHIHASFARLLARFTCAQASHREASASQNPSFLCPHSG